MAMGFNGNNNTFSGTYQKGSDWDLNVNQGDYKGTIYLENWNDGLYFQPVVSGIPSSVNNSKFWIGI